MRVYGHARWAISGTVGLSLVLAGCGGVVHPAADSQNGPTVTSIVVGGAFIPTSTGSVPPSAEATTVPARAGSPPTLSGGTTFVTLPASSSSSPGAPRSGAPLTTGDNSIQRVLAVYDAYLADVSGLYDYVNQSWLAALSQVATTGLVDAIQEGIDNVAQSQDHAVGTLRDSHQLVKITSSTTAAIADCLDEQNWYLVHDATGDPDPAISRGYFVGVTKLLIQNGRWYVDIWQPTKGICQF